MDSTSEARSRGLIESLPDLRRALLAEIIQHVVLWPSGEPRLKISRMKGLHDAAQAYEIARLGYMRSQGYRPTVEYAHAHVEDTRGWIELPKDIEAILQEVLWGEGASKKAQRKHPSYLLVSDTKERYLRAYFIRPTDSVLPVTIEHEERIGALAAITYTLQKRGFNILTSLSRLHTHGGRAQYELVLQPPVLLKDEDEATVKREFEKALGTRELIGDYKLAVSYKNNYSSPTNFNPILENSAPDESAPAQEQYLSTEALLDRQYSALSVQARGVGASDEGVKRLSIIRSLVDEEKRLQQVYVPRRILFVSYSFESTSEHTESIVREAAKVGFEVTLGKKLKAHVHRDGIIRLIGESTDFLGIWSEEGAYKVSRKCWPSPWLHWELGVAAAKGLRPRLLISDKFHHDAWKVYPEVPHTKFQAPMFLDALREVLGDMASEQIYP